MKAVTKTVKKYGNSGGVYVPSSWIGGRVSVELVEEPANPVKDVLEKIDLRHVVSAILYGSYARNEMEEGSDIDMLLITDEDIPLDIPAELRQKCDVQAKTVKGARMAMVNDPIFHKIIMDEARALINHTFLEELKKEKLNPKGIKTRIGIAESSLGIAKGLFEAGSEEIIYPVMMRLKEMLVLECLLENKKYSTELLKKELLKHGVSKKEFSGIMSIYRSIRNSEKSGKYKISKEMAEKLIFILEAKMRYVKKAAEKRHRIP